jgi:four helix bundle protein
MNSFKDLKVWQKALDLAEQVYALTTGLPMEERFGLQSQSRRCAVSIASNIAEGAGRNSKKEFQYFLSIALGSCFELETQLLLVERLQYGSIKSLDTVIGKLQEVQKMIIGLQRSLG